MARLVLASLILLSTYVVLNANASRDVFELAGGFEGDIILQKASRALGRRDKEARWDNGIVPYRFSSSSDYTKLEKKIIEEGMDMITEKTGGCVKFVEKKKSHSNWINIRRGSGCSSLVGRSWYPGSQDVSLATDCIHHGTIVHELMHALGFFHEQSRKDRDDYIKINYENMQPGMENQFRKETNERYFYTKYDLDSVMQYGNYIFSANGKPVIEARNGKTLIHPANKPDEDILTDSDIKAVRSMYKCNGELPKTTKPPRSSTTLRPYSAFEITLVNDYKRTVNIYQVDGSQKQLLVSLPKNTNVELTGNVLGKVEIKAKGLKKKFTMGRGKVTKSKKTFKITKL